VFAFLKYGVVLLKVGKFLPTLISMSFSFLIFASAFGWIYGLGLVLLIFVHEMGHVLFARAEGLPASAPLFLGPFGAVIRLKRPPIDARQEAVIAIGGPITGTLGSIACLLWATSMHASSTSALLLTLAYTGFFINLFNLVPFSPLDGGRVAGVFGVWPNLIGLAIMVLLFFGSSAVGVGPNPVVLIILIIGGISLFERIRHRGKPRPPVAWSVKMAVGVAYLALMITCVMGMSAVHSTLVNLGYAASTG
jgi:Zn-dependent protease